MLLYVAVFVLSRSSHAPVVLPRHAWTEGACVVNKGEGESDGQSKADTADIMLMDGLTFVSLR